MSLSPEDRQETTTLILEALASHEEVKKTPKFSRKFWLTMVGLVGALPSGAAIILWGLFEYGVHEAGPSPETEERLRTLETYVVEEQPRLEQMTEDAEEAKESLEWLVCDRERRRAELRGDPEVDCSPLARNR